MGLRRLAAPALLVTSACAHFGESPSPSAEPPRVMENPRYGWRLLLPPGRGWAPSGEGAVRSARGVEVEVRVGRQGGKVDASGCLRLLRGRLNVAGQQDEELSEPRNGEGPARWSFRRWAAEPGSDLLEVKWALFPRGADCYEVRVVGPAGEYVSEAEAWASRSFAFIERSEAQRWNDELDAGDELLRAERFHDAFQRYQALAEELPDFARAHARAGHAGFTAGRDSWEAAVAHYEKALALDDDGRGDPFRALDPADRKMALMNLGIAYAGLGRLDPALQRMSELETREPDSDVVQYNFACVLALRGENNAALQHLHRALELAPALASHARRDPDLKALRGDADFQQMLDAADRAAPGAPFNAD